jgi:hypothetical protein
MKKLRILSLILPLLVLLLTACQAATLPAPAALPAWTVVPLPAQATAAATAPAPTPTAPAAAGVVGPSAAEKDPAVSAAVETVSSYFQALEDGDFQAAAQLYSDFSLMIAGATRAEAALDLQGQMARGARWSELVVKDSRRFDARTVLVHVTYRLEAKDSAVTGAAVKNTAKPQGTPSQMDELWPVRLENGRWLYNRANLIDYRVLDVPEQATGGLIVKPRQLARFSDHITLTLMVQNQTNEAIVMGQANEVMATFLFNGQKVEAVQKRMIFDRLRSSPQATIEVRGLFETYPDGVTLRQWKNYKVKPWFTFSFTD